MFIQGTKKADLRQLHIYNLAVGKILGQTISGDFLSIGDV
jgi:hypothetical protein